MTRQYKSMQAEMTAKIENLENLVAELKNKLGELSKTPSIFKLLLKLYF